jgi:spore maturation protein CgeB
MKIIYSYRLNREKSLKEVLELDVIAKSLNHNIITINQGEISSYWEHKTHLEVDSMYINRDSNLLNLYNYTHSLIDEFNPDIFIVIHDNLYHNNFIKSIKSKVYTVFVSGDDPENSDNCSKPYVEAYHHSFSFGVWFDEQNKITDKFKEWGAPLADIWPHGVHNMRYDQNISLSDLVNRKRSNDIIFIGGPHFKEEKLFEVKQYFGSKFHIHGNWTHGSWMKKLYGQFRIYRKYGQFINRVEEVDMKNMYLNSKIGLNMHMSFGPSNLRTFELMANGVAQVVDCKKGIDEWFDIGKDLLAYETTSEAIELINKLLKDDDYRKEIAFNGAKKTQEKYTRVQTFANAINLIKKGINNDKI